MSQILDFLIPKKSSYFQLRKAFIKCSVFQKFFKSFKTKVIYRNSPKKTKNFKKIFHNFQLKIPANINPVNKMCLFVEAGER